MRLVYPFNRLLLGLDSPPWTLRGAYVLGRRLVAGWRAAVAVWYLPEKPPLPIRIQIENTNRCNLHCIMCGRRFRKVPDSDLPGEVYERLLQEVRPVYVTLNGDGEPLLDPGLEEKIRAAKRWGCAVAMPTNMTLLNRVRAPRLLESGIDLLTISLDGATGESYQAVRKGADFERVKANIRDLLDELRTREERKRPRVNILLVLQRSNLFDIDAAVRLQEELGIRIDVVPVKYMNHDVIARECGVDREAVERLREMISFKLRRAVDERERRLRRQWLAAAENVAQVPPPGRVCLKPWTTAYVDSRGNVFPCCLAVDAGGRLRMGNVREDSFVRIWHGERYVRFRIAILENRRGVPICDVCPVEDAGLQRRFTRWFAWMPMRLKSA